MPSRVDWKIRCVPSGEKYASAFSPPKVSWRMLRRCRSAGRCAAAAGGCAGAAGVDGRKSVEVANPDAIASARRLFGTELMLVRLPELMGDSPTQPIRALFICH